jgi:MFS family permease
VLLLFLKDKEKIAETRELQEAQSKNSLFSTLKLLFTNIYFWLILFCFAVPSLPGWATKNWLPTLFAKKLSLDIAIAGPLATLTIAVSSFVGVIFGGILSDKWLQKNIRSRVYTSSIGLLLMVPALLLIGFGQSLVFIVLAGCCFGIGFGMFDANNMPILYQFISPKRRATAYGIMNMTGIFAGAMVTDLLGKSTDAGNLGHDFAMLAGIVLVAFIIQTLFLRPKKALTIYQ